MQTDGLRVVQPCLVSKSTEIWIWGVGRIYEAVSGRFHVVGRLGNLSMNVQGVEFANPSKWRCQEVVNTRIIEWGI
jgi:hypothetical protein